MTHPRQMEDAFESWLRGLTVQFASLCSQHQTRVLDALISESGPEQKWHLQNKLPELLYRDFITNLPLEISERILGFVDCKSLLAGSCVSHGWNRRIAESSSIWHRLAQDLCGIISSDDRGRAKSKDYWKKMTVSGYRLRSLMREGKCFSHRPETDLLLGINDLPIEETRKILALDYNQGYIAMGAVGSPRFFRGGSQNAKCICVWSLQSSEITHCFPMPLSISVIKLFWPEYVINGTFDGRIESRSLKDRDSEPQRFPEQHTSAVLTLDGNLRQDILVSGSSDFRVKVWKLSTGELVNVFSDFSHWIDSVLYVPKEKHCLKNSVDRDLIITMTRDAIQIFDTNYSTLSPTQIKNMSFREKISIPIYLLSSRNYGEDPRENFFTPGFNLIGGNRIAFIRQLPMFDTHTIGDVDILIMDAENGSLLHSVHINKKVRKLLAVGTRFALILLPYVDARYQNLALVDLKTSEILGGCTVPHSHATTPDFAQITIGPADWLDGLLCSEELLAKSNSLVVSLAINDGTMHNVYWSY